MAESLIRILLNIKFILLSNTLIDLFSEKDRRMGYSSCCLTPTNVETIIYP